jgi:hypothetical protein
VIRKGTITKVVLKDMLTCSKDANVYVDNNQTTLNKEKLTQMCKQRKYLNENGNIYEELCLTVSCIKNGAPCKPFADEGIEIPVTVECEGTLPTPNFVIMNKTQENTLTPVNLNFDSGVSRSVCCKNESTYLQYFGKECPVMDRRHSLPCNFTDSIALHPCSENSFQQVSQFCIIPNSACVVKTYFVSGCGRLQPFSVCETLHEPC